MKALLTGQLVAAWVVLVPFLVMFIVLLLSAIMGARKLAPSSKEWRMVALIFGLTVVFLVFIELEGGVLKRVIASSWIDRDRWLGLFRNWAWMCLGAGLLATVGWFFIGKSKDMGRPDRVDVRLFLLWLLFFLPAGLMFGASVMLLPRAGNGWLAYVFNFLNAVFFYWICTALFSPSSVKFVPWGAKKLRRW